MSYLLLRNQKEARLKNILSRLDVHSLLHRLFYVHGTPRRIYLRIVNTSDSLCLRVLSFGQQRLCLIKFMVKTGIDCVYIQTCGIRLSSLMKSFETKRSECVSQVTKILKEAKKDFILRDTNNGTDVLTVEEKPSVKGAKAGIRKGNMLKKHALCLWSKQVGSSVLCLLIYSIVDCGWNKHDSNFQGVSRKINQKCAAKKIPAGSTNFVSYHYCSRIQHND